MCDFEKNNDHQAVDDHLNHDALLNYVNRHFTVGLTADEVLVVEQFRKDLNKYSALIRELEDLRGKLDAEWWNLWSARLGRLKRS